MAIIHKTQGVIQKGGEMTPPPRHESCPVCDKHIECLANESMVHDCNFNLDHFIAIVDHNILWSTIANDNIDDDSQDHFIAIMDNNIFRKFFAQLSAIPLLKSFRHPCKPKST